MQRVTEYADMLHISRITLNHAVMAQFGVSASHLLKQRLLEELKNELLFSNRSVSQLADDFHFSDPSHLMRFSSSRLARLVCNISRIIRTASTNNLNITTGKVRSLSAGNRLFEHRIDQKQHQTIDFAGRMRADRYTTHAGDAGFLVHFLGVRRIDGSYGTFPGTHSAISTSFCGFRYNSRRSCFPVRTVAGNLRFASLSGSDFLRYLPGKFRKLCPVFFVRPSGGIAAGDGVFGYGRHGCHHLKSGPMGDVLQFD